MSKPELGTKRLCARCGAKFYDLHHSPITCPKCESVFGPTEVSSRFRAEAAREPVREVEPVLAQIPEAQLVSLEDPDAETDGEQRLGDEAEDVIEPNDEVLDDAALMEESEQEDGDVAEIIEDDVEIEEGT